MKLSSEKLLQLMNGNYNCLTARKLYKLLKVVDGISSYKGLMKRIKDGPTFWSVFHQDKRIRKRLSKPLLRCSCTEGEAIDFLKKLLVDYNVSEGVVLYPTGVKLEEYSQNITI